MIEPDKITRYRKATLVKLATEDGYWTIKEDQASIGKVYTVDILTRRRQRFQNIPTGDTYDCEVVDALDEELGSMYHFQTELLDIE